MKLWDKGYSVSEIVESFTVGRDRELDLLLAPWDVLGSIAHICMLKDVGLLEEGDWQKLTNQLREIYTQTISGTFVIEEGVEDVHSQVELLLTRKLGEAGKKIHSGRSRNDQVLLDLKLYFLDEVRQIVDLVNTLFQSLQNQSNKYQDVLIPGYTHMQIAMPSSFGLWFGAYAESLIDDVIFLQAAFKVANQNPLGSAAGYGSSFPLNRTLTTQLLGFETMSYNVVYAQMGRGKTEKLMAYALASLASTMNKLAADVCLYMSQNFGFLTLPASLTTGSSIMPHKKNPDVFEILRAKTNKIQSLPFEISHITTNLTSGYHRDLQLTKESLLPAIEEMKNCLQVTDYMVNQLIINKGVLDHPMYDYLFSVEMVNEEVLNGVPFREAYKKIGTQIDSGEYQPNRNISHTHEGSIGNLCHDEIAKKMNKALGGFSFEALEKAKNRLLDE